MSGNSVVPGFGRFLKYMEPFADRFIVIGGTAIMFIKDEGDVVLGMNGRATHDIDLIVVSERVDAEFVAAFEQLVCDGGYNGYYDRDNHPHYYRFERTANDGQFPQKLELLTKDPFPEKMDFRYASLAQGVDDYLSAMVLDPEYYRFALTHSRETHGLRALSREGLIVLKAYAAMNHLRDSREENDAHKKGVSFSNYKKHRKDVFLLTAGLVGGEYIEVPQSIKHDLQKFYDEHHPGLEVLSDVAKSISRNRVVVENVVRAYSRMFGLNE